MLKKLIPLSLSILMLSAFNPALARGGGFGGGGHFGGGGGFGGGFGRGGFGGGGFDRGGFDRGGGDFDRGGFDRGGFDGGFDRGGFGGFGGYRSGVGSVYAGDRGMEAGAGRADDFGFGGTQLAPRTGGEPGMAGLGNRGTGGGGNHPDQPYSGGGGKDGPWSGGGGHDGGGGKNGPWSGGGGKDGGRNNWNNNHDDWGFNRISGNNFGNHDNINNFNYSPTYISNRGYAVRNNFNGWGNFYGHGWYGYHPGCWYYGGWGGWNAAWMATDWAMMGSMLALDMAAGPGYGGNVTYNNNQVYYNNQPVGSASDYYSQAQTLAQSCGNTNPKKTANWKPLGVFSLVQGSQTDSTTMFQIAMNDKGDVAGNYYDMLADQNQQIHGKLDKKSQRVAWTVGDNKNVVYDTGLANLMKPESPLLVHFGKDRTEQFLLIRLQRPDGSSPDQQPGTAPTQSSYKSETRL